jgi:hypothetical protein
MNMHVIQWNIRPRSYYKGTTPVGPEFDASLDDTPKFDSEQKAAAGLLSFPLVALCGSIIVDAREHGEKMPGLNMGRRCQD